MPRLPAPAYRLDLWTNVRAAGGTRIAFLLDGVTRAVRNVQRTRSLEVGRSSLTFEVAPSFRAIASLAPQAGVIGLQRYVKTGPDAYASTIEEWRVVRRSRSVRGGIGWYRISCVPIEDDLLDVDTGRELTPGGLSLWRYGATDRTPTEVLQDVVDRLATVGHTWVDVGTVTPTTPVTFALEMNATPRAIIDGLIAALAAQGVDAEFQFRLAPGLTQYLLDLPTRIAGSMSALRATTAANAPELEYDEDALEQATVVIPFTNDGVDLREWQFEATAVDGATGWITIAAIGGAVAQLVAVDDQFNAKYLHRELTGKNFLITDTSLSPLRIRVAAADLASGLSAGERLALREAEDLAGTRRAFGTPAQRSPFEVVSVLSGPPRLNVDDLYDASGVIDADDQYVDWQAERSTLVAALPSGDFDHLTGIFDLGSAPGSAPQVDDKVWFLDALGIPPGRVTGYHAGSHQITLVPLYEGDQFTVSKAGITTARCYRPIGTPMWIVDSVDASGQLLLDAFTGGTPSPNDIVEVVQRCQGTRLVELADPAALAATRRKIATLQVDVTGATNRVVNGEQAAWAGAPADGPDGWSIENIVGTVTRTRETDPLLTRYGGWSWGLAFGVGASAEVFTPPLPIHPVPGMDLAAAALAIQFTRFTGSVPMRVTLYKRAADGTRTALADPLLVYPTDTTVSAAEDYKAALNAWYDAVLPDQPLADIVDETLQLGFARPAGAANPACTVVVDAAMVVQRAGVPQAASGGVQYVFGSDALGMVAAANVTLQDRARPLVSYAGRMIDVFRLDATRYAPFELVPGRDVALTVHPLGVTQTVRLLATQEDLDAPASVQVTLDRVRPDVGRLVAARLKPQVPRPAPIDRVVQPPAPPSLSVRETHDFTSWLITYRGAPAVTVRIDGGAEVAAPPSPITVPRPVYGGAPVLYEFFARSEIPGIEPATAKVIVHPQPYNDPAAPILTGITITNLFAPGDGGGTFDLAISRANEPGGTSYAYSAIVIPDSGNPISGGSASASGIAYGTFPIAGISGCAMAPGDQLQVTVTPSDPTMAPKTVTVPVP